MDDKGKRPAALVYPTTENSPNQDEKESRSLLFDTHYLVLKINLFLFEWYATNSIEKKLKENLKKD